MPLTAAVATGLRAGGAPVAYLLAQSGAAYRLSQTPAGANLSGIAPTFGSIPRQGQAPLLRLDAPALRVITWSHDVVDIAGGPRIADAIIAELVLLAGSGQKVQLRSVSGRNEGGRWFQITDLQVAVRRRWPNQTFREASLSWTFTQANDVSFRIASTPPPPIPVGSGGSAGGGAGPFGQGVAGTPGAPPTGYQGQYSGTTTQTYQGQYSVPQTTTTTPRPTGLPRPV
jgi:hypothetical protein